MQRYSLSHVPDAVLLRDLATLAGKERGITVEVLVHIAEVDERKLYLPAAYPSMFAYCVGELRFSEEAASKRIHAARKARLYPAIFTALADGRLHLSAVVMLAPHLTPQNADELISSASHKTKSEIERLLAERFPRSEMPERVQAVPLPAPSLVTVAPGPVDQHAPGRVDASADQTRVAPVAPQRYALQLTIGETAHENLRYAQALLGHRPAGDGVAAVVERALEALVRQLEKQKFAASARPRPGHRRPSPGSRHIPAHVRRAVWERDDGQCTFVSDAGRRCEARAWLEFDHVREFARGGEATVAGIRLRCRGHNQYQAERTFGAEFMRGKRQAAQRARAAAARACEHAPGRVDARDPGHAEIERANGREDERELTPWLRALGYTVDEVRRAAAHCQSGPDASLEERVRLALRFLRPPHRKIDFRPIQTPSTPSVAIRE